MNVNGVYLDGRLGNHMFQYALALAKAKERGGFFFVDQTKWNFQLLPYFSLPSYNKTQNAILTKLLYMAGKIFKRVNEGENDQPYKTFMYYKGFFQNEKYFAKYIALIRNEFEIEPAYKQAFAERYGTLFSKHKTIAVHIRRTDLLTLHHDLGRPVNATLSEEYYKHCFAAIDKPEEYKIIFATDDIEYVKQQYGHWPNAVIEDKDVITDFQVLLNADIVISASSSFSWMAAYLNKKPAKTIYTPQHWGVIPRIMPPDSESALWKVIS